VTRQRIDKWLWFARFVKTRPLAAAIVSQGQVRLNKVKVGKPSHEVGPGDVLTLAMHGRVRVIKVLAIGTRRGPASEAQTLYEDMAVSQEVSAASEKLLHKP
jgi:ribosome-associated heat shock protein Hsp15